MYESVLLDMSHQVFDKAQELLSEQISYLNLYDAIEEYITDLFKNLGYSHQENLYSNDYGCAFPLGISVNHIAAHDSCNPQDTRIIYVGDVVKIDVGLHIEGYIIDTARTFVVGHTPCPQKEALLSATRRATLNIIDHLYPGMNISDIHTLATDLTVPEYNITPITYLSSHSVDRYQVHSGQILPFTPKKNVNGIIQKGTYAIETFATTGPGRCIEGDKINHFSLSEHDKGKIINKVHSFVRARNGLPFSSLWIYKVFGTRGLLQLQELKKKGLLITYPPLMDKPGSLVSQYENTTQLY